MNEITVYHYDAFSSVPHKGNPAGVVAEADALKETDMQKIACAVGFNETVFVLKSNLADVRLRYFTPGHEINLCGHATMAALFCLASKGRFSGQPSIRIETNVGVLPIRLETDHNRVRIEMKQDSPRFLPFNGDIEQLSASIGLKQEHLDLSKPIVYGSTGTWTLLIPVKRLDAFQAMKPDNRMFPEILRENPAASVHPFCFEAYDEEAFLHARHFSSPYSGTVEDPVTGTASGVLGAYYLTYINRELNHVEFVAEQGQEIDRDGRVWVKAVREGRDMDIRIAGTAVFVKAMKIAYE